MFRLLDNKRGRRARQRQTVIANLMELVSERYFPLAAFQLPDNMNEAWAEITKEWPPELHTAVGTVQDGTLYMKPEVYNNLASSNDHKFRAAVGSFIHELLHLSMRDDGSVNRTDLWKEIRNGEHKDLSERIHLYFEESCIELLTIYIMVNDYGVERYWEDFKLSYVPAVLALAKYANEQPINSVTFVKSMLTTTDLDVLVKHVQPLEDWGKLITLDEILSHPEWIEQFCDIEAD